MTILSVHRENQRGDRRYFHGVVDDADHKLQVFPKATLRMAFSLLIMIAQMRSSNPAQRPTLSALVDTVLALQKSSSQAVLFDHIGINRRAVEWDKW